MILFQSEIDGWHSLARSEYESLPKDRSVTTYDDLVAERKTLEPLLSILAERHKVLERIQELYHADDPFIAENLFNRKAA